jgi:endonuclease/exonuclease/phosphatase (EEP) superfamily protein YafD
MTERKGKLVDRLTRCGVWLMCAYATVATSLSLLSLVDFDVLWPLEPFEAGAHVLLAAAPLFGLWAWRLRRWRLLAALGFTTLCWLSTWVPWLGGSREAPPRNGEEVVTVLTWNLGLGLCDVNQVALEILRVEPDVVLLQEARIDQARALFELCRHELPFQQHFQDDRFSKAYLSRREPTAVNFVVPEDSKNFVELRLAVGDSEVTITSMHTNKSFAIMGRKWWGYERMMEQVELAATRPNNLVVGDFNTTERNAPYEAFCDLGLVDSYRELHSGPGFTFPAFGRYRKLPVPPIVRIDYQWHTPDLRCLSVERTAHGQSDHRGLVGRFAVSSR